MTQYARIVEHETSLSTDFGLALACRKLGMDESALAEKLGRYSRGPRKGKIKGNLRWQKVIQAGWVRMNGSFLADSDAGYDRAPGFVCRLVGTTFGYEVFDFRSGETLIPGDGIAELAKICQNFNAVVR
jgi:hypothetical protein